MFKSIQYKIILVIGIVGIIAIFGLGLIGVLDLYNERITDGLQFQIVQDQILKLKISTVVTMSVYGLILILIGVFIKKSIINPVDVMSEELKKQLNEVNEQKKQIETVLLHMADGIISFNMEGDITIINPAATDLLQLTPRENTFNDIFKKLNIDIDLEKTVFLENWTSNEQKVQVEDKFLDLHFSSIKNEDDTPLGIMVVIQDITEHERLDMMRTEFIANVSHELKTPITSIMGYSETLLETEYDKETQKKFLNVILSEAKRMTKLVLDLLELSKLEDAKIETEPTDFDITDVVRKCQEQLQVEINKKKQIFNCYETSQNIPQVHADKDGIERVILNIVSNSIKYTGECGEINVYIRFLYNDVYVKIVDNGMGIPEKDLKRIYERFYRVDKARSRSMGGTGLGLSIAQKIMNRNNGKIEIKSEVGKGTEVTLRLPANKEQVEEIKKIESKKQEKLAQNLDDNSEENLEDVDINNLSQDEYYMEDVEIDENVKNNDKNIEDDNQKTETEEELNDSKNSKKDKKDKDDLKNKKNEKSEKKEIVKKENSNKKKKHTKD